MTDTPPMVERVARRIMDFSGCEDGDEGFRACAIKYCHCRKAARAAIEAMREPTGDPLPISGASFGMTRAGAAAMWDATERGNLIGLDQAEAVWKAMIAAALGEA